MKSIIITILFSLIFIGVTAEEKKTCAGTTKAGTSCKIKVKQDKKYCHHHDPKAKKCAGKKKDGNKCRMNVYNGKKFCHHHKK